jgi:hypothetical protein
MDGSTVSLWIKFLSHTAGCIHLGPGDGTFSSKLVNIGTVSVQFSQLLVDYGIDPLCL